MQDHFDQQLCSLASHIKSSPPLYIDPILDPHLPLILSSFHPLCTPTSTPHNLTHDTPRDSVSVSDYPLLSASKLHSVYCIPPDEFLDWVGEFNRNITLFSIGEVGYTPVVVEGRANVAVVIVDRMLDLVAPALGIRLVIIKC